MTKDNLITSINNFITAVVTVAKTRSAFADIVNEIYSPTILDDETTTNVFQRGTIQTKFDYTFTLKKRGNIVFISGRVANNSTTTSNALLFLTEIIDPEFYPSVNQNIIGISNNSERIVLTALNTPDFKGFSGNLVFIPASGSFNFNGFYFTND